MSTNSEKKEHMVEIKKSKLILVEGKDEVNVFKQFLKSLSIEDVQIYDCGGKINFKGKFKLVCDNDYFMDNVTKYAIIQDSDNNSQDRFKSIQHYLKENGQPVPKNIGEFTQEGKKVGVFLLPGFQAHGMLEDLYLETLKGKKLLQHAENCFNAIKADYPEKTELEKFAISPRHSKAKVLSIFMATEDPVNSLGIAAQAGYWDFDHPAMKDLISFLENFRDN